MATSVYANRYAQAVFRMALEANELNVWQSDLRKMASMARDEALFATLGEISPGAMLLVCMLAAKGRLGLIEDISDQYQELLDGHRGVEGAEIAEVTTAIPLDDEYKLKLAQRITDLVGRPVVLRASVDAGVVGGIIIRVGDKLIDGSIRSRLTALKRELGGSGR